MLYITKRLNWLDFLVSICVAILVTTAYVLGHFFYPQKWSVILVAVCSIIIIEIIFFIEEKIKNYKKGKRGEDYVEEVLNNIPNVKHERGIKTKNGDLDFLVYTNHGIYGLEVKNMPGRITYDIKKDKIKVNKFSCDVLNQVKASSAEVQNKLAENDPQIKFVQPVVVFCDHRACVDIPENKITSGNVAVYVIGSSQLIDFFNKH